MAAATAKLMQQRTGGLKTLNRTESFKTQLQITCDDEKSAVNFMRTFNSRSSFSQSCPEDNNLMKVVGFDNAATAVQKRCPVYKLSATGRWQMRFILLTRDHLYIAAPKPPVHKEGFVGLVTEGSNTKDERVYLVLSEGKLSYWRSEFACERDAPCDDAFPVDTCVVQSAGILQPNKSMQETQKSGRLVGKGARALWKIQNQATGHQLVLSSDTSAERSAWSDAFTQHKQDISSGKLHQEIVDTIPVRICVFELRGNCI